MIPSSDTRQVNPVLTNMVREFNQSVNAYTADAVSPRVSVSEASGTIFRVNKEVYGGDGMASPITGDLQRAIGAGFERPPSRTIGSTTYSVVEYGEECPLDDTQVRRSQVPFGLERMYTDMVMHDVLRARENRVKSVITATGTITNNTTLTGIDQWSDYTNSDPIDDIETGIETLKLAVYFDPTKHVLGCHTNDQVARYLRWHPNMVAKVANNITQMVNIDQLQAFFGFEEVTVAELFHNSASPGQSTTDARFWGDDFVIYVRPRNPGSFMGTSVMTTLEFRPLEVEQYREEPRNTVYLVSHEVADFTFDATAAYLIKDCLA